VLRAKPEKVYRAFIDADAMVKWLPPNGFTAKVHHMEVKVGGMHKMSFTNFTTGESHSFGGRYLELIPYERIRYTDTFDDLKLPGEMQVKDSLLPVGPHSATELSLGHNVSSREEVDVVMGEAQKAGAVIVKPA
jgi:uncharacterized protein YndB with AHSA1/START domain